MKIVPKQLNLIPILFYQNIAYLCVLIRAIVRVRLPLPNNWFRRAEHGAESPHFEKKFSYVPFMSSFHSWLHSFDKLDRTFVIYVWRFQLKKLTNDDNAYFLRKLVFLVNTLVLDSWLNFRLKLSIDLLRTKGWVNWAQTWNKMTSVCRWLRMLSQVKIGW